METCAENKDFVVLKNRLDRSVSWHYDVGQGQESRSHYCFSVVYMASELIIGVFYVDLAVRAKGARSDVL